MTNTIHVPPDVIKDLQHLGASVATDEVRKRNMEYLSFITGWPCMACGATGRKIDAHHVISDGIALKCPDEFTVPLCHRPCHLDGVHAGQESFIKELGLWEEHGYHAFQKATLLYMAYFILSRHETERDEPGSLTRQVAYRFNEMSRDSRIADTLTPHV